MENKWICACEQAQEGLITYFWNEADGVFMNHYPVREEENWIYWWHAHAIDALLDGYLRSGDSKYLTRIEKEYHGVWRQNGNTLLHNWYDDMEWMALALLRLYDVTNSEQYKDQVLILWEDIKTAWNDSMGGGLAWKKDQLDYKNTPANGPAAILAFRLYQRFQREDDLLWGKKILDWNTKNLMNKENGFIWDGMNRMGDGEIDYDWKFTYCQGVIIGALLEEYAITGKQEPLDSAIQTAYTAMELLSDSNGILAYEGEDDCGLFRGIFVRYLGQLLQVCPDLEEVKVFIHNNADSIADSAIHENGLIGSSWDSKAKGTVDLAQHLSGIMMLEMASLVIPSHIEDNITGTSI